MGQERDRSLTLTASGALSQYRRVKWSGSTVSYAGVEDHDGTLGEDAFASGDIVEVKPRNYRGTTSMVAAEAITIGADVYPAASGKVGSTVQGERIGIAMEAATADGDVIEILELPAQNNDLQDNGVRALSGATMTVTAAMCKRGIVSTSHTGAAAVNLPPGKVGMEVTIVKIDANAAAHTITPDGSEKIQAAATFAAVDAQYDAVTLRYSGSATIGWVITGKHIS